MPADAPPAPERLRRYKVKGNWCWLHPSCVDGFKMDRETSLIYGPYKITDPRTGEVRFARHAEEASCVAKFCPYCNGS